MTPPGDPRTATPATSNQLTLLLIALLSLLALSPAASYLAGDIPIVGYFVAAVIITALRPLDLPPTLFTATVVLALATLAYDSALSIGVFGIPGTAMLVMTPVAYALFLGAAIAGLARHIMGQRTVTRDLVRGGIAIYLLIGTFWLMLYQIAVILDPGAFSRQWSPNERDADLLYFSFTTMTTLGYGDIAPASRFAKMLTSVEAVIGPIFLAVFIARLVGLQAADPRND